MLKVQLSENEKIGVFSKLFIFNALKIRSENSFFSLGESNLASLAKFSFNTHFPNVRFSCRHATKMTRNVKTDCSGNGQGNDSKKPDAGHSDARCLATTYAVVHAAWKLKPPVMPSMSSTSPAKYRCGRTRLSSVFG